MDKKKSGALIAQLRRAGRMTQESLGEKLGVSGKTVSRWETGESMPDIENLETLASVFGVSADELIAGELSGGNAEKIAENAVKTETAPFSREDRIRYFKEKWKEDHFSLIFLTVTVLAIYFVVTMYLGSGLFYLTPLFVLIVFAVLYNKMMIYVEDAVYGKPEEPDKDLHSQ